MDRELTLGNRGGRGRLYLLVQPENIWKVVSHRANKAPIENPNLPASWC